MHEKHYTTIFSKCHNYFNLIFKKTALSNFGRNQLLFTLIYSLAWQRYNTEHQSFLYFLCSVYFK